MSRSHGRGSMCGNRRHVYLYGVALKPKGQAAQFITLPEATLTIDHKKLETTQEVDIQNIRLSRPHLEVTRAANGRWNFENLPPIQTDSGASLPELEIDQGQLSIVLYRDQSRQPTLMTFQNSDLRLIPSGKRQFVVNGVTRASQFGDIEFEADWNVDAKTWDIRGEIPSITADTQLIDLAVRIHPELQQSLDVLKDKLQSLERAGESGVGRTNEGSTLSNLAIGGSINAQFELSRREPDTSPAFAAAIELRQAHLNHPLLPFPLHDLHGRFECNNSGVKIPSLTARNGITRIELAGSIGRAGETTSGRLDLKIQNLLHDDRLRKRLPPRWRRIYDEIRPSGPADLQVTFDNQKQDRWRYSNLVYQPHDCSALPSRFAYPVHGVNGTIKQSGADLEVDITGLAGRHPVTLKGVVLNAGPEAESLLDIEVKRLALDETFRNACNEDGRRVLRSLKLRGKANAKVRLHRPPGLRQKFGWVLDADVANGSLEFVHFRYPLSQLTGHVSYDSRKLKWTFTNLEARHASAQLDGYGVFDKSHRDDPGLLQLSIHAENADLDNQLRRALPPTLQDAWDVVSPTGTLEIDTELSWIPGSPVEVAVPNAKISAGSVLLAPFPFPLDDVDAELSYSNQVVVIEKFAGRHDDSLVGFKRGLFKWFANNQWRTWIEDWHADSIICNVSSPFRRAFGRGTAMRTVVEELNPQGRLSFRGGLLDFRGIIGEPDQVTAAWDMKVILSGNSVTTGVDLNNVYGFVTSRGTLDGNGNIRTHGPNRISLNRADLWGYHLTHINGPYQILGERLTIGSEAVINPPSPAPQSVPADQRLTASFIGGSMSLDGTALLQPETPYHLKISMTDGKLAEYARSYLPGVSNFRGDVDGWIDMRGRGESVNQIKGKGQVQIRNAALYEQPIIAGIVRALNFAPPANAAFRYAIANFTVGRGLFEFSPIILQGDAIELVGKGTVGFDERLDLNFDTKLADQAVRIPLVNFVFNQASRGWVGVRVGGEINNPRPEITAAPLLDDAVRQLMGTLNLRFPGPIAPPRTGFLRNSPFAPPPAAPVRGNNGRY